MSKIRYLISLSSLLIFLSIYTSAQEVKITNNFSQVQLHAGKITKGAVKGGATGINGSKKSIFLP
jgi:hypothetical protein